MTHNTIEEDEELQRELENIDNIINNIQKKLDNYNKEINNYTLLKIMKKSILGGILLLSISMFWTIVLSSISKILPIISNEINIYILSITNILFFTTSFIITTIFQIYNHNIIKKMKNFCEIEYDLYTEEKQKINDKLRSMHIRRNNNKYKYTYKERDYNNIKQYIREKTNSIYKRKYQSKRK